MDPHDNATAAAGPRAVPFPSAGDAARPVLDTGRESIAIVALPDGAWDRGPDAGRARRHAGYDLALFVRSGSGTLRHGADAGALVAERFAGPAVLVIPAGTWHHVAMDPALTADGLAFLTRSGTVIEPFTTQMAVVIRGTVQLADLPASAGGPVPDMAGSALDPRDAAAPAPAQVHEPLEVRILPVTQPAPGEVSLPLDSGRDSLLMLATPPATGAAARVPAQPLERPVTVDVHRHPTVDEYIVLSGSRGDLLDGTSLETMRRIPFQGPCVLVMPAGRFHRVVVDEEHPPAAPPVLVYADRAAVVERHADILARAQVAPVEAGSTMGVEA